MLRTLMAGMVGGVVVVVWSAIFSVFGPVQGGSRQDAAMVRSLVHHVASLPDRFGPQEAQAGVVIVPSKPEVAVDLGAAAQGLGVACLTGIIVSFLLTRKGAAKRPTDRLVFAVLLGCFASGAMLIPGGLWAQFSTASASLVLGEVVVGWLLAGLVIVVITNPQAGSKLA